ncbi:ribosome small subunit-dependent GTPase A [Hathewaya massiliensis]|uniref:ribosome small subunit-dependent GTPase A n=1 Tax=Hathewaya massiliensis TaxID=1964382 RepID=UPI0011580957|nr:ribosome small subunit-dependent GTPase A [Hathewaya massiliensis]
MEGIIVKGVGGLYIVKVGQEFYKCTARGKFRFKKYTPMVGDKVRISSEKDGNTIEEIFERTSELIRPFVANVTQAFVVFTLKNPEVNFELLNKFLVLCENSNLEITLCLNKIDLIDFNKEDQTRIIEILKSIGYDLIFINAKEGDGIDIIKDKIRDNISVFCGPSGVGKSTILNSIIGKEYMETGAISEKLKRGKHTTRHAELIEYEGGFLVDTPGFSSIATEFIDGEDLIQCFPEFRSYQGQCKFSNCMHNKEPGCIIKGKLEKGEIYKERYEFYIKLLEEIQNLRRY